jgi:predicted transcriptional regulator
LAKIDGESCSYREVLCCDLAKRADVSPTTVLNLEAGRVEAQRRTVRKLTRALEADPAELVE